jgi:protein-tyrosine phosphatase
LFVFVFGLIEMIDLHSHILPGIDDGATSLDVALEMARRWVDQGVTTVACTPHILPGLYDNSGANIEIAVKDLTLALALKDIPLQLVAGADNHIASDFVAGLKSGRLLTLARSRYVLVEPPHHVLPPRLESFFFDLTATGYVPILTHPERLTWANENYQLLENMVAAGVWMQLTSGSFTGLFGRSARHLAEKMLDNGLVHIIASDAHDMEKRPPNLAEGFELIAQRAGRNIALDLFVVRPRGVLENATPESLPVVAKPQGRERKPSWFGLRA